MFISNERELSIYEQLLGEISNLNNVLDSYINEMGSYSDYCLVNYNGEKMSICLCKQLVDNLATSSNSELIRKKYEMQRQVEVALKKIKNILIKVCERDKSMTSIAFQKSRIIALLRRGVDLPAIRQLGFNGVNLDFDADLLDDLEKCIQIRITQIENKKRKWSL